MSNARFTDHPRSTDSSPSPEEKSREERGRGREREQPKGEKTITTETTVAPVDTHASETQTYVEDEHGPPPLNYTLRTTRRERMIILYFAVFLIEAGILPLILFYALRWGTHLSMATNLAIITAFVGTASGLKLAQRQYFLWYKTGHETRRPIGAGRWGVDFLQVLLITALTMFFVPLIVGSSLSPPLPAVVAFAIPFFMLTFCIPLTITGLFPHSIRLPFRLSSLPAHEIAPPLTYTIVEDIIAVDGGGNVDFRQAWRHRYECSHLMRHLLRRLALAWGISGNILAGGLIAAAWTAPIDIGYGLSFGLPWLWALVGAAATLWWVKHALVKEKEEWTRPEVHREIKLHLVEGEVDREAAQRVLARRSASVGRARAEAAEDARRASMGDERLREKREEYRRRREDEAMRTV